MKSNQGMVEGNGVGLGAQGSGNANDPAVLLVRAWQPPSGGGLAGRHLPTRRRPTYERRRDGER
jgi:hypothetical protein